MASTPGGIGQQIKARRESLNLTQEAAASAAGVSKITWQSWEQGVRQPHGAALARVAQVLNVPPASLTQSAGAVVAAWLAGSSRADRQQLMEWLEQHPAAEARGEKVEPERAGKATWRPAKRGRPAGKRSEQGS